MSKRIGNGEESGIETIVWTATIWLPSHSPNFRRLAGFSCDSHPLNSFVQINGVGKGVAES